MHATLIRTDLPRRKGRGKREREIEPRASMHGGSDALERIEALEYGSDYDDDGYVLSSVLAVKEASVPGIIALYAPVLSFLRNVCHARPCGDPSSNSIILFVNHVHSSFSFLYSAPVF